MTDHDRLTRREFTLLGLAGMVALGTSCGSSDPTTTAGSTSSQPSAAGGPTRSDVARLDADPALAAAVVAATNRFATELYPLVAAEQANLAFSPLSIAIALAMTSEGARGTSREQIEAVFHLDDIGDPHGGWNALDQALESRAGEVTRDDGTTDELALTIVNQLWAQADFEVEAAFLAVLAANYDAGVEPADFAADPEAARTRINTWVAEQTRDRIPELIPPDIIDELTRLVLTNAVYFTAPWASPFDATNTRDGRFTRLDGSTVETPLMAGDGAFGAIVGEGWQAVELPYAGLELELLLVVPDAGRFAEVEAALGDGLLDTIPTGLERRRLHLTMPRFELRTPVALNAALAALGMPDPFDPAVADFTGINAAHGRDLYIAAVVHEAFVVVDEAGTEAAAATAVIIALESASPTAEAVLVDRPFLWAIRDVPTGVVTFLGRVLDPSR